MDTPAPHPSGTVTFLFTDFEGSTRLREQHPEARRLALALHHALLHRVTEAHAGNVFKTMGDAFCAAFAHAADALDTQRALIERMTLSNFFAHEDRETGEIVLHMSRWFLDDWIGDAYSYRIQVP